MQFKLTFEKDKKKLVIFSLPQTNHYQTIQNQVCNPAADQLIKDKWRNCVGIFSLKNNKKIQIKFKSSSKVYSPKIDKRFSDLLEIIRKEYCHTLDYLTYGNPIDGLHSYKQALDEKITDCGGFSTYLAWRLKSKNILSRLVVGFLVKENLYTKLFSNFDFCGLNFEFLSMHAWLEVLLPNKIWVPLDPSIEWRRNKGLTKREGGLGYIPADRLVTSFGQNFKLKIENKIYQFDLLQKPIYL